MITEARRRIDHPELKGPGSPQLHLIKIPWNEKSPKILDLGCGTGIWVTEMAR